jgi:hypothetical protein
MSENLPEKQEKENLPEKRKRTRGRSGLCPKDRMFYSTPKLALFG